MWWMPRIESRLIAYLLSVFYRTNSLEPTLRILNNARKCHGGTGSISIIVSSATLNGGMEE